MYKHTFNLVDGQTLEMRTNCEAIPYFKYGDTVTFVVVSAERQYRLTIPVINILYIETELIDDE